MNSIFRLVVLSILAAGITVAEAAEKDSPASAIGGGDAGLGAGTGNAAETDQPIFKLGGFGTLGASHSSQKLGDYVVDGTVPKGAGLSNNWAWGNDSRIGVQATASFTPKVSAILQVISEYQYDGSSRPSIEWANVKYAVTPDAYIRAGRIVLPSFLNSDNRKVGYSYPWLHPPVDVYRQRAITNSDGLDAMYRFGIGEAENSIKIIYGRNKIDYLTNMSTSRGIRGIFDTFEYGPAKLRVGYQEREFQSKNHQTGVIGPWTPSSDLSAGASYDPGKWFVISEWIERKSTTKIHAMYISAGYRIDKITPYLAYSQDSPASTLPGFIATAASIQSAKNSQNTVSLGMRWFFMKNTDLKLQYDQVHLSDNSNGNLLNVPVGVTLYGTRFHVISAALDFVF